MLCVSQGKSLDERLTVIEDEIARAIADALFVFLKGHKEKEGSDDNHAR